MSLEKRILKILCGDNSENFRDYIKDRILLMYRSRAAKNLERHYKKGDIKEGDLILVNYKERTHSLLKRFLKDYSMLEASLIVISGQDFEEARGIVEKRRPLGRVVTLETAHGAQYVALESVLGGPIIPTFVKWEKINIDALPYVLNNLCLHGNYAPSRN